MTFLYSLLNLANMPGLKIDCCRDGIPGGATHSAVVVIFFTSFPFFIFILFTLIGVAVSDIGHDA